MTSRAARLLALAALVALVTAASVACVAPPARNVSITLAAASVGAPADGISTVDLTATVVGAPGAIVGFEVDGAALLAATSVAAVDGVATVSLYAPMEDQLGAAATSAATVRANVNVGGVLVTAEAVVTFTLPTQGAPTLLAYASPDRVLANGPDPIRVIVDGRRLANPTVSLSTTGALDGLPSTLVLDDTGGGAFHGELVIPANYAPGTVTLTLRAEGVPPVDVPLVFYEEGEAAFDLSGTFAQVNYSVVEIGNLIFLNPDPQCLVAPSFSLITVTQVDNGDGTADLTLETTTCAMRMGDVNVHFLGRSTTRVEQGFIDATNEGAQPQTFTLTDIGPGASFVAPQSMLDVPMILGADMSADLHAPLPTTADDPRVRDSDGDGNPGVTIINSTQGEQYVVSRGWLESMRGTISGSNALDGDSEALSESRILGSGDGGFAPTMTPKVSPWSMRRVDGQYGAVDISSRDGDATSISCADIEAYIAELQASAPAPTAACN